MSTQTLDGPIFFFSARSTGIDVPVFAGAPLGSAAVAQARKGLLLFDDGAPAGQLVLCDERLCEI